MTPEKLILEGIYSYKNKTVIDFSTLCTADLFGIFGMVGSGKSAILEAVTYVLYGKIERLSSKMMNYNMMNLTSDKMSIDLSFTHKNEKYRFTFNAKRNKKDFNKIETPKRSAYILKDGDWLPLFDKNNDVSAEQIIGLNYDNFRRTVIVPQGRFQEFLHLDKKDRTEMLMELFQLNRFDLYSKTAALSNRNTETAAAVEGALSGLQDADENALLTAETQRTEVQSGNKKMSGLIAESDKLLHGYEELAGLMRQLTETRAEYEKKTAESSFYEKKKAVLLQYEDCRSRFESQMDIYELHLSDLKLSTKELDEAVGIHLRRKSAFEHSEAALKKLSDDFKQIEQFRKHAEWYFDLAGIENDRAALSQLDKNLEAALSESVRLRSQEEGYGKELERLAEQLEETDNGSRTNESMAQLNNLYNSLGECERFINSESENLEKLKSEREELQQRIDSLSGLDEAEAVLEEQESNYKSRLLDAEIMKGIGQLALHLEDGKPCPVCGAVEHPQPAGVDARTGTELYEEGAEIEAERLRLKDSRKKITALMNEASSYDGRIKAVSAQIESRQAEKSSLLREFPEGEFSAAKPEYFQTEYKSFNEKLRIREGLQRKILELNRLREKITVELNKASEALNNLKLEDAAVRTRIKETEQRMNADFLKKNKGRTALELSSDGQSLRAKADSVSEQYQKAEKDFKKIGLELEGSISTTNLLKKRVAELTEKTAVSKAELERLLDESEYENLEAVSEILSEKPDTVSLRAEIEKFEHDLSVVKNRLEDINTAVDSRTYEIEVHNAEKEKNIRLKQELENSNKKLGELTNIIQDLKMRLVRKAELEKELTALRIRGENINTLKNLFKGKQFIDYAATIYLRELCEAANARFRKLTRESLRLELDESNNFIIRDYLNEGKTRSVKTLSGGQTFQAAFSLSLALADSIGRERSGFFFLDEGFGSLDKQSLSLVFESLKSLKKEERTVGIISHVEELKQEIDTFITVEKDNEEGSFIINSWNS